jgi:ribosomal peptide maturation radical SAM protein 1
MMKPILLAAMPWNLADMMSVQVATLKAFLLSKGSAAIAKHYYIATNQYFSQEEIDVIHTRFLGDHLYAMLLFPEHANDIAAKVKVRSSGVLDPWDCLERLKVFTKMVVDDIVLNDPMLVCFTTTHMQYFASIATARAAKERLPQLNVELGGLALYGEPAKATLSLFPWIDFIIVGEGETALWRLAEHVHGNLSAYDVPQLIFRDDGEITENQHVDTIPHLDLLPLPDYSDYFEALNHTSQPITPRATIEMVRGCRWGRCSFCIEGLPSRGGFRSKTPNRVAQEIQYYIDNYKILDYVVSDPDVAFNVKIFEEIRKLRLGVEFMVELSGFVPVPDFQIMIDAGVSTVQIGIESFSPAMLKAFNKGVTLAKYIELLRICAERGVKLVYNNIYKAPFETQEDLDEAVDNMSRLLYFQPPRLSEFRVSVGSHILENLEVYGIKSLVPSEEVAGYPEEVATRVGMLTSFNAGFGFEKLDYLQSLDYSQYHDILNDWRQVWSLGPKMRARRGNGFIRVDHLIGDKCYHIYVVEPLQIAIFEYCQQLRSRRDLLRYLHPNHIDKIDAALECLWEKRLIFKSSEEYISLAALHPTN